MQQQITFPWLEIHLATLLFGLAGLIGKMIDLPVLVVVVGRLFFAALFLGMAILVTKRSFRLNSKREGLFVFVLGAILALHWYSFFYSIHLSTVAIGLLSFSSYPLFVVFMEPLIFKERIQFENIAMALVILLGVTLVVPDFSLDNSNFLGILWGILSGLTFAVISLMTRIANTTINGTVMAFYQDISASIFLIPFIILLDKVVIDAEEWFLLVVLGVLCTGVAHTLFIRALKQLNAQKVSLIVSLEPVYGIVFAVIVINEIPSLTTLLGGLLILLPALFISLFKRER